LDAKGKDRPGAQRHAFKALNLLLKPKNGG
jgi:hypothetical protein